MAKTLEYINIVFGNMERFKVNKDDIEQLYYIYSVTTEDYNKNTNTITVYHTAKKFVLVLSNSFLNTVYKDSDTTTSTYRSRLEKHPDISYIIFHYTDNSEEVCFLIWDYDKNDKDKVVNKRQKFNLNTLTVD